MEVLEVNLQVNLLNVSTQLNTTQHKRQVQKSVNTWNTFIEHFGFIGISTDLYHKQKYFTAGHSLSNIDNAAFSLFTLKKYFHSLFIVTSPARSVPTVQVLKKERKWS